MARRYLGWGITNSSGVAKLDHNASGTSIAHSYTGVGAGELDVVAISGSLQSETYTITDAIFKDMGTSSDYGAWSNWTSYEPKLTRSDYCKVEVDTENSKTGARMYKSIDTSNSPICIEFDVKDPRT